MGNLNTQLFDQFKWSLFQKPFSGIEEAISAYTKAIKMNRGVSRPAKDVFLNPHFILPPSIIGSASPSDTERTLKIFNGLVSDKKPMTFQEALRVLREVSSHEPPPDELIQSGLLEGKQGLLRSFQKNESITISNYSLRGLFRSIQDFYVNNFVSGKYTGNHLVLVATGAALGAVALYYYIAQQPNRR